MEILIIAILILLNGFFALAEIALVSSKRQKLEQYKTEKRRGSKTALKLISDSESFLSAIQVGITLIGIITGVYGGIKIADDIAPILRQSGLFNNSADEIALTLTVLVITYFSIVIGELVPKTIALSNPEKIAIKVALPVYYFSLIFYPFVRFLSISTSMVNRLIGIRKKQEQITSGELRHMLRLASGEGMIERDQNLIHEKVFYFSDKKAKHIMTHRIDIEWIDTSQPYGKIKEAIFSSSHSRLICAPKNLDEFQGILKVKDFFSNPDIADSSSFSELLTQPVIVPESADAHSVLKLFKQRQAHFCVVVNEFGGLEGVITLHDILENLIGEIPEEGDSYEPDIFIRDDKSVLVSGDAPVEVLDGIFENYMTDLDSIDYSTVAGFVLKHTDKIPQIGDKFVFRDYIIEIVDIDGNRIDKILVRKN